MESYAKGLLIGFIILFAFRCLQTCNNESGDESSASSDTGVESVTVNNDEAKEFEFGNVSFVMKKVAGGTFNMGAIEQSRYKVWENEIPLHKVKVADFYMGETEVTQELWETVMGADANTSLVQRKDFPVSNVSWEECQVFVAKLSKELGHKFRLPTEAEWEYAAKTGANDYCTIFSGSNDIDEIGWYLCNSGTERFPDDASITASLSPEDICYHPVALKRANYYGLYDMTGNVSEWCQDYYLKTYYQEFKKGSVADNPQGPKTGKSHSFRGGSFVNTSDRSRVACRWGLGAGGRDQIIGLRIAMSD